MKMKSRLIENNFPVEQISDSCRREKSIRQGHISTLQTWWARRPLAVCRATIFLALLPSVKDIKPKKQVMKILADLYPGQEDLEKCLMLFTAELSDFSNSNNEKLIGVAKKLIALNNKNPSLIDTFGGGGSIPLESIRLGVKTYASDLNPIATTGLSLALELAPGMSDAAIGRLLGDVDAVGAKILERTQINYVESNVLAYFWARTYRCPECGYKAPLIQSKWLCKTGVKRAMSLEANRKTGTIRFAVVNPVTTAELANADKGTVGGKLATCLFCNKETSTDVIQAQGMTGQLGEILYAKYVRGEDGKEYLPCNGESADVISSHAKSSSASDVSLDFDLPLDLNGIRHLWAIQYGIRTVGHLFNPRQRRSIECLASEISKHKELIEKTSESRKEVLFRYLSLVMMLNKVAIYSNRHSWWQSNGAFPANIFVRQAISMVWNYVEIPPFSSGAGGWLSSSKWVVKALANLKPIGDTARVACSDAENVDLPDSSQDLVVIDPPYFDSITYAYLSDFFYPWMKVLLEGDFPKWYAGDVTPKREELIVDRKHKLAPSPKNSDFFREKMARCLKEARRVLTADGVLILMYGHKDLAAWLSLFQAITDAGFRVTTSWPIHTERSSKFKHSKVEALGVSCVLVLRAHLTSQEIQPTLEFGAFQALAEKRGADLRLRHPELMSDPVALSMSIFPLLLDDYMHNNVVDSSGRPITLDHLLELANI